ncbi:hypothetical protein FOA52_000687 [Chlamydomonas sp. UWO 241]|nr:hypothetical protein FOA52_000687 [Chlamydomonas sp. UWO 241]
MDRAPGQYANEHAGSFAAAEGGQVQGGAGAALGESIIPMQAMGAHAGGEPAAAGGPFGAGSAAGATDGQAHQAAEVGAAAPHAPIMAPAWTGAAAAGAGPPAALGLGAAGAAHAPLTTVTGPVPAYSGPPPKGSHVRAPIMDVGAAPVGRSARAPIHATGAHAFTDTDAAGRASGGGDISTAEVGAKRPRPTGPMGAAGAQQQQQQMRPRVPVSTGALARAAPTQPRAPTHASGPFQHTLLSPAAQLAANIENGGRGVAAALAAFQSVLPRVSQLTGLPPSLLRFTPPGSLTSACKAVTHIQPTNQALHEAVRMHRQCLYY